MQSSSDLLPPFLLLLLFLFLLLLFPSPDLLPPGAVSSDSGGHRQLHQEGPNRQLSTALFHWTFFIL